jgi:hypothetical protein
MQERKGINKRLGIVCINSNCSLRTSSARQSQVDGRTACVPIIQPTLEEGEEMNNNIVVSCFRKLHLFSWLGG